MALRVASLPHGGDLAVARQLFPDAPEPFIDLSTGINPFSYPLPQLTSALYARLPEPADLDRLLDAAAASYGTTPDCVVAAPGTQILLPLVMALAPPGRAAVLGPTYAEHARAALLAGHRVTTVCDIAHLEDAGLAVIVNPNNPDGRVLGRDALLALAEAVRPRGGLVVVDEAFMDVAPKGTSLGGDVGRGNIVVLRSFGKFFGLAGLRLGFALARPDVAARLGASLGPWAVSGPAIAVGTVALKDASWAQATRAALERQARRLDVLLAEAGIGVVGGTSLFRLARLPSAGELFDHLGRTGILVRRFADQPAWLRFGLPVNEEAWQRLGAAVVAHGARDRPWRA